MKFSASLFVLALGSTHGLVTNGPSARRRVETKLLARKAFITGNWKLNPQSKAEAVDLARGIAAAITDDSPADVGLFVPFPFLQTVKEIVGDKLIVGAEVRESSEHIEYHSNLMHQDGGESGESLVSYENPFLLS
jgi:Triosephosphate isomerase